MSQLYRLCGLSVTLGAWLTAGAALAGTAYVQTNIISDGATPAAVTDANLKNPWGLAFSPSGPFWIANNGTGIASIYDASGTAQLAPVTIPGAGDQTAAPTGLVFNSTGQFKVNNSTTPFLFVGEDGVISGWTPSGGSNATLADSSVANAVYKGAALGTANGANRLFVADFHNNKVQVFDGSFKQVTQSGGTFTDPNLPAGYAPFDIANVNGKLFVTYALQNSEAHDDVKGPGHGFIDVYDTSGKLLQRFASAGTLNSPWGVALAPANFGQFSNDLLVGNFGDGRINAFNPSTGALVGQVSGTNGQPVSIDGLWSLKFGNGGSAGKTNELFFTAGTNDEADGLFGKLAVSSGGGGSAVPLPPMVYVLPLTLLLAAGAARRVASR